MSADQAPGRPTEQEWALDLAEEVWTDEPTAAEVDLMRCVLATEALARLKAHWQAEALREAAYHFGVIWGSGLTTEWQVAEVLKTWAEHGIGARADRIAREAQQDGGVR